MIVKPLLHHQQVRIQYYLHQLPFNRLTGFHLADNFLPPLMKLTPAADRFFT
jgi:hypothetical protein